MSRNASTLRSWVILVWLAVGLLSACSHILPVSDHITSQPIYLALTQAAATLKAAPTPGTPVSEQGGVPVDEEMIGPNNAKYLTSTTTIHQVSANSIAFLPGGKNIVLLGESGLATADISRSKSELPEANKITLPVTFTHPSLLTVSREKAVVGWVNDEKSVDIVDFNNPDNLKILVHFEVSITGMAFSPNGDHITISTYDNRLRTWSGNFEGSPSEWTAPSWLIDLAYSPDQKYLGGVDPGNFKVYIFDAVSGDLIRTLEWMNSASPVLYGAYFSPDWKSIAWIARGTAQIMNLENEDFISAVAWSPNSQVLAIGSAATINGSLTPVVVVWDAGSGDQLSTLSHTAPIQSISFSSDGKELAVLDSNGDLQTWSIGKR
jgi:WD40 repeat protein